jgi:hypothetical protein
MLRSWILLVVLGSAAGCSGGTAPSSSPVAPLAGRWTVEVDAAYRFGCNETVNGVPSCAPGSFITDTFAVYVIRGTVDVVVPATASHVPPPPDALALSASPQLATELYESTEGVSGLPGRPTPPCSSQPLQCWLGLDSTAIEVDPSATIFVETTGGDRRGRYVFTWPLQLPVLGTYPFTTAGGPLFVEWFTDSLSAHTWSDSSSGVTVRVTRSE